MNAIKKIVMGLAVASAAVAAQADVAISGDVYIQNGLIAHWDGIENAGAGQAHSEDISTSGWVDLVAGKTLSANIPEGATFLTTANGVSLKGASLSATDTSGWVTAAVTTLGGGAKSVEIAGAADSTGSGDIMWIDALNGSTRLLAWGNTGGNLLSKLWTYSGKTLAENKFPFVANADFTAVIAFSAINSLKKYKDGVFICNSAPSCNGAQTATSGQLKLNSSSSATFTYHGLRIYNRQLSAGDVAWNAAMDKIRFSSSSHADALPASVVLPAGYRWNATPQSRTLESNVEVTFDEALGVVTADDTPISSRWNRWTRLGAGETVTLTATPSQGCFFAYWVGLPAGVDATATTVTVPLGDASRNIKARFYAVTPADFYVSADGDDDNNDGTTPLKAFKTIEKGIAAANAAITGGEASATVHVEDGTYAAPFATLDAAIAVVGNPEHPENVIVDANKTVKTVFKLTHADAVVRGLSVINARGGTSGGGTPFTSYVSGAFRLDNGLVSDCVIRNTYYEVNTHDSGAYITGGRMTRCVFKNCKYYGSTACASLVTMLGGVLENCLFTSNALNQDNGSNRPGLISFQGSATVINCTIVNNGKMNAPFYVNLGTPTVVNTVMYKNNGANPNVVSEWASIKSGTSIKFINCAANGALPKSGVHADSTGNLTALDDLAFIGYANGDYRPAASVLVDAGCSETGYGTYGAVSTTDLAGAARVCGPGEDGAKLLDIGAYERQSDGLDVTAFSALYESKTGAAVTFSATDARAEGEVSYYWDFGDGTTSGWTTEATVTHAFANPGTFAVTVKAKTATQSETAPVSPARGLIYVGPSDFYVDVANGDDGNDGTSANPLKTIAAAIEKSLLGSGNRTPGVTIHLRKGTYEEYGLVLDFPVTVKGEGATRDDVTIDAKSLGRAFMLDHADALIENVTIQNGYLDGNGANVYITLGTVRDCDILNGATSGRNYGANVYMEGGRLANCRVIGGISCKPGSTSGGTAWSGGVYAKGGAVVENCLIKGNYYNKTNGNAYSTDIVGTGAVADGSSCFINCTFTANHGPSRGGKPIHVASANARVINCVFYGNQLASVNENLTEHEYGSSNPKCFINCAAAVPVPSGSTGCLTGLTDADFIDYQNGDYRPAASVLVDAGVSATDYGTYGAVSTNDLAGAARVRGPGEDGAKRLDIGAYERQSDGLDVTVTPMSYSAGAGLDATFVATVARAEGAVTYLWDFGDDETLETTEATVTHIYKDQGTFAVIVKAKTATQIETAPVSPVRGSIYVGPSDIYVDAGDAGDDGNDGTSDHPLKTIKAAIEKSLLGSGERISGVTIHLADSETAYASPFATLDWQVTILGNPEHPENVVITDATAGKRAFTLSHADAKVAGVTITGAGYKTSGGSGGHILMSAGTVEDCIIEGGRASANNGAGTGGNVSMSGGCLRRCIVRNGRPADSTTNGTSRGANIHATGGVVENCLVTGGAALTDKTSSFDVNGATKVINCTIVKNTPGSKFGGIHLESDSAQAVNCVIYGNGGTAAKEWGGVYPDSFVNCAFGEGLAPENDTECIATVTDKAFADYENGDYRLNKSGSVLKGAGTKKDDYLGYGATSETDLIGTLWGKTLDIGCYAAKAAGLMLILR